MVENDLAYWFGISQPAVFRILITWINFVILDLRILIYGHQDNKLIILCPKRLKTPILLLNVSDATEIFVQAPSNPQAQQSIY